MKTPPSHFEPLTWRKSSHSASGGNANCVEARATDASHIAVRDSKHTASLALEVDRREWTSFVNALRCGDILS